MINEKDLVKLGFIKIEVSAEESGDFPYYYYTFQPSEDSHLCLITQSNDEAKEGWVVSFFEENLEIKEKEDLRQLVDILKRIAK